MYNLLNCLVSLEVLGGISNKPPTDTIRFKFMGLVSAFKKANKVFTYKFLLIKGFYIYGIFD